MTKKLKLFYLISLYGTQLFAQSITGKVVDLINNEPLPGAVIISPSDTVVTNHNGRFSINETLPARLRISFLGYTQQEVTLNKNDQTIGLRPSPLELGAVMVSAGATSQSIYTSPTSIGVIDHTLLKRDAPFTTTTAINRTAGVLMQSGTFNTNRLTIRGIGSRSLYGTNKVKAYYDEIPLTDGSGNSTIEDIDQNLIDRIEIIKGPNSSIYGAGLGGVVRLFSHRAEPLQSSLSASQTIGSFGMSRSSFRADHYDGSNQFTLGATNLQSDGYRQNSDYNKKQVGLSARSEISQHTSISTLAQYTWLKAYIPSSIDQETYENSPKSAAYTWNQAKGYEKYNKGLLGFTLNHAFDDSMDLKMTVFGKYRDAYEARPFNIFTENTHTIGLRAIYSKEWDKFQVHLGTELFRDRYNWQTFENNYTADTNGSVQGELLSENEEIRKYQNVFLETAYLPTSRLSITGGVNLNFTNYDLNNEYSSTGTDISGSYSFDAVISPKIGINYQWMHMSVFGNISHGFSPPSLEETLYPDGQINPNIQPESGWNYETGIRGQAGSLHYDLGVYYMNIHNLLVAQRTGEDAYVGVNAGINHHLGVDLQANYELKLNESSQINLFSSASWMHYRFGEFTSDGETYDGNKLTGMPEVILNLGAELLTKKGIYGNINGTYTGEIPLDDANSLYANSYVVVRSKVGYLLQIGSLEIDTYLGTDNLTDTKYASMLLINATGFNGAAPRYYYPGNPRSFFGGIKLNYSF